MLDFKLNSKGGNVGDKNKFALCHVLTRDNPIGTRGASDGSDSAPVFPGCRSQRWNRIFNGRRLSRRLPAVWSGRQTGAAVELLGASRPAAAALVHDCCWRIQCGSRRRIDRD
jgi:hypothetical protein